VSFVGPVRDNVTPDPPALGATNETSTLCDAEGSATLVAVIVAIEDDGGLAGAV
jgi:hypothetical protein